LLTKVCFWSIQHHILSFQTVAKFVLFHSTGYAEFSEAANFAQQIGAFEVRVSADKSHGKVLRQVVLNKPIGWCIGVADWPITLVGGSWYVLVLFSLVHQS